MDDPFQAAYTAGAPDAVAAGPDGPPRRALISRLAPSETVALKGCVLTRDDRLDPGHVVVGDGVIQAVQAAAPDGVPVLDTGGVILPGLIDLHGHPEFNVFPAWEPPQQYVNRYAWRESDLYHQLVRDPQNTLMATLPPWTQLRYAEIRALTGGVTAVQGSGRQATQYQDEALVRNVDKWIFGGQVGRAMIDLPSAGRGMDELAGVLDGIAHGTVKAFYIHLAEGRSDNPRSAAELGTLAGLGALTAQTVVIHGTALSADQLGHLHDAGAKLVWSPESNLRLYGQTTLAASALRLGIPVGLCADWLPSGSTSLLAEMKVARRCLGLQSGADPGARLLVDMVTRDAAGIAGLDDHLGVLEAGRPADITVFERVHADPWESVARSDPAQVDLVLIGGDVAYGRPAFVEALVGRDAVGRYEQEIAWGEPMLLDTGFQAHPGGRGIPTLSQLRAALIGVYPQVGPIYA